MSFEILVDISIWVNDNINAADQSHPPWALFAVQENETIHIQFIRQHLTYSKNVLANHGKLDRLFCLFSTQDSENKI
jgi:hypothetical protein